MGFAEPFKTDDQCWQAVVDRDPRAEDRFFYSVRTTGVFCRVTCGTRLPLRHNVSFHATTAAARAAGCRPCRRCFPEGRPLSAEWSDVVARVCRTIEESVVPPSTGALAAEVAMSSSHLQRVFKKITGLTPRQYARSIRSLKVGEELRRAGSVTEAAYLAGFASAGRFYADSAGSLGMTPTSYRRGAEGQVIRFGTGTCSLGWVLVAVTDLGVCAILLGDGRQAVFEELKGRFPKAELVEGGEEFGRWMDAVISAVDRPRVGIDLPLDIRGTAFQYLVWRALRQIPVGSTATYSEIAERIGRPAAARAVAAACAANPLAVAIPCHRVVRADASFSGYRWGVERKNRLLQMEAGPD